MIVPLANGLRIKFMYIIMHTSDIDECLEGRHQCIQVCQNTIGSYSCDCRDGFIIDVNGTSCDGEQKQIMIDQARSLTPGVSISDINECSDGTHSCQQVCNNAYGSHRCSCHDGYQLNGDGFTCRGQKPTD